MWAFVDHGPDGTGEPLAALLRPGNAGSNTATDHITVARDALAQLPGVNPSRPGKKVLIRTDGAGGTKDFTTWAHRRGVQYSVGFTLPHNTPDLLKRIPAQVWTPAYDAERQVRPGADVAELTDLVAEKRRGEAMGWYGSALTSGTALGSPITGATVDSLGFAAAFIAVGCIGAAVSVAALVTQQVRRRRRARVRTRVSEIVGAQGQ